MQLVSPELHLPHHDLAKLLEDMSLSRGKLRSRFVVDQAKTADVVAFGRLKRSSGIETD
jgi:hypothetical protein